MVGLAVRIVAATMLLAGAIYCLVTLRDPIPALSAALDDRHAYFATTLLVFAPVLIAWHVIALVVGWRRTHAAIPHAAIRR